MENIIQNTKKLIIQNEPFYPRYYNHSIKGSSIGIGFKLEPAELCPVFNKTISNIELIEAEKLLLFSLEQNYKVLSTNFAQIFNYLDEFRQIYFLNLSDLISIDILASKFKTSFLPLAYLDYDSAVDLMRRNNWTQSLYSKNKRLRMCLDALQFGR